MNRREIIRPEREEAGIASRSHDLPPQVLEGIVAHGADAGAALSNRGLSRQAQVRHRPVLGILGARGGGGGEEQDAQADRYRFHRHVHHTTKVRA
jgi:hypothetical protein